MTTGIHHITAIASDVHRLLDFYTRILGLRLVKKTVNQDDWDTYHLFFGDRLGHPGMDLTFFVFLPAMQGRHGNGQVTTISFAVPPGALVFWKERFDREQVRNEEVSEKFGRKCLKFYDHDGQHLQLVEIVEDELVGADPWMTEEVPIEVAIRYFFSAKLSVFSFTAIEGVLMEVLGYEKIAQEEHRRLYEIKGSSRAKMLEVSEDPAGRHGLNAAGTVHHIAFRVKDEVEQNAMREKVLRLGLYPTEMIDRFYFKSVYFRTPAGILFEIATDEPGFTADEPETELGKRLALPPFLEVHRGEIEKGLVAL